MNPELMNLVGELGLDPAKLAKLVEVGQSNPAGLPAAIAELGITPDALQKLMAFVMANPDLMRQAANSAGMSEEELKNKFTPEG